MHYAQYYLFHRVPFFLKMFFIVIILIHFQFDNIIED